MAFWRDKNATAEKRNASASRSRGADGSDATAALKVRARRRLIGAVALLLAAVIIVPLLLDPAPRPTADNIPIDIPSEKAPFTPRLSLPPVPDPGQVPVAPPPDLPPTDAEKPKVEPGTNKSEPSKSEATKSEPAKAARPSGDSKPAPKEAPAPKPSETKAKPVSDAKAAETAAKSKSSRILLQAAALSTDAAAQDLSERLRKAGFAPFTEKVDTADGVRFRVRVGPYTTRDEAQRAQARLRALGVSATLVLA